MKLSWGYRVTILYVSFASMIVFLVYRSVNQKIDLVASDYYAQELNYQSKKESIERNLNLKHPANLFLSKEEIVVEFPSEFTNGELTGQITIFRPSDKSKDQIIVVEPDINNKQTIPLETLIKGMYRIKVEFTYNKIVYYLEKQVVIR